MRSESVQFSEKLSKEGIQYLWLGVSLCKSHENSEFSLHTFDAHILFTINSFILLSNSFHLIYSATLTYVQLWLHCFWCPTLSKLPHLKTFVGIWLQVSFILVYSIWHRKLFVLNNVCVFFCLIKMGNSVCGALPEQQKI